jgi:uncharacterized protein involved in tolerance to divalent cations
MSSQSQHWTLVDNDLPSDPNYHSITQQFTIEKTHGFFAVIAEPITSSTEQTDNIASHAIGAKLAIEAAHLAFNEIIEHKLNFANVFLTLFSKQWKALVLLYTIKNANKIKTPLIANKLSENGTLTPAQKELIAHYDPSIALLYQFNDQLVLLQTGNSRIALVNQRYHSEIKKAPHASLTALLLDAETLDDTEHLFNLIDIKHYQLEMIALLPEHYTATKTMARLNANIIKLYRHLELDDAKKQATDYKKFILLKKQSTQKTAIPSSHQSVKKIKTKKKLVTYTLSFFALIFTVSSYYLWQANDAEAETSTLIEKQNTQAYKAITEIKNANKQEIGEIKPETKYLLEEEKLTQAKKQMQIEIQEQLDEQAKAKEKANKLRQQHILEEQKQQEEIDRAAKLEADKLAQEEADRLAKLAVDKLAQQEADKLAKLKADKLAQQETDKLAKLEDDRLAQQKADKLAKLEDDKLAQQEADKLAKLEADKLAQEEADKLAQQEDDRRATLEANRLAQQEADRLIAKKRLDIEKNKAEEKLRAEEKAKQQRINAEKPLTDKHQKETTAQVNPTSQQRKQQQTDAQKQINEHLEKKKRTMQAELERQKQTQDKAKDNRKKLNQQTAVHQIVGYMKRFNQHAIQLKQKIETIKTIEKNEDLATNRQLTHKRTLLKGKEENIRKHLDSLSTLYLERLKKICSQPKTYPVSNHSPNKIGRIARTIISQHLTHCPQMKSFSSKQITTLFLTKLK